jgi:hypothetical protein
MSDGSSKPDIKFYLDRPSARTDAEREARFEDWWAKQEPYRAAVIAKGDTPWTQDPDEARELFDRRYTRPEPPKGLSVPTIGSRTTRE